MLLEAPTYLLLAIAIASAWMPPLGARRIPVWPFLLAGATLLGLVGHQLAPVAIAGLAACGLAAWAWQRAQPSARPWHRWIAGLMLGLLVLAMALHLLPGFNNLKIEFRGQTKYLNFDKAAAGLLLLVAATRYGPGPRAVLRALPWAALLAAVALVLTLPWSIGPLVRWAPTSWNEPMLATFLVANLLFTCIAEEVFFRGFLQEALHRGFEGQRAAVRLGIPVLLSGLLFGLSHWRGGLMYVAAAGITGLVHSAAYARTRRIELPVLSHFLVNLVIALVTVPVVA